MKLTSLYKMNTMGAIIVSAIAGIVACGLCGMCLCQEGQLIYDSRKEVRDQEIASLEAAGISEEIIDRLRKQPILDLVGSTFENCVHPTTDTCIAI
jgi:hypothetical protein